jgi:hypothetical protein
MIQINDSGQDVTKPQHVPIPARPSPDPRPWISVAPFKLYHPAYPKWAIRHMGGHRGCPFPPDTRYTVNTPSLPSLSSLLSLLFSILHQLNNLSTLCTSASDTGSFSLLTIVFPNNLYHILGVASPTAVYHHLSLSESSGVNSKRFLHLPVISSFDTLVPHLVIFHLSPAEPATGPSHRPLPIHCPGDSYITTNQRSFRTQTSTPFQGHLPPLISLNRADPRCQLVLIFGYSCPFLDRIGSTVATVQLAYSY